MSSSALSQSRDLHAADRPESARSRLRMANTNYMIRCALLYQDLSRFFYRGQSSGVYGVIGTKTFETSISEDGLAESGK